MNRVSSSGLGVFVAVVLAALLAVPPMPLAYAQQHEVTNPGLGDIYRDDPCDQLPAPPGAALGIDKRCRSGGSSSGVAKGDFNGDGFADLAVGVPGEEPVGKSSNFNSGAVNVIYGSPTGLTGSSTAGVPRPQYWSQGTDGGPGTNSGQGHFGSALASGDFNGDGFSDLAIGVPGKDIPTFGTVLTNLGGVVVIYGSSNGLTTTDTSVPGARFFDLTQATDFKSQAGAELGSSLAWGDFDGDGVGDLAVGAPRLTPDLGLLDIFHIRAEAGAVWVLHGAPRRVVNIGGVDIVIPGGLSLARDKLWLEADFYPSREAAPQTALLNFGAALTSGDFDGNGCSDLAIGTPGANVDGNPSAGQVNVMEGCTLSPSLILDQSRTLGQSADLEEFGASLAAGDFNGDGISDLAIGVPFESGDVLLGGAVNVIYGHDPAGLGPVGSTTTGNKPPNQLWRQNMLGGSVETGDTFGAALAAGDFNGDGRADLAIGVPSEDLVVSGANVRDAGEVDVIYGSFSGLSTTAVLAPQIWHQDSVGIAFTPKAGDSFGSSLTAWNFGKNQLIGLPPTLRRTADLAIGVPFRDVNGLDNAGELHVIYGSWLFGLNAFANGQVTAQIWNQNSEGVIGSPEAGDQFGRSVY